MTIAASSPTAHSTRSPAGLRRSALGLALLAVAVWGLWRDVEWLAQPFYVWAWAGYILAVDGFALWRRGHSLLTTRRRYLFPLCVSSITFWYFFELLNLHLQNWYYVGVFRGTGWGLAWAAAFVLAAFSTVFVGIFTTYEALTAAGLWKRWRGAPGTLPRWVSYAVQGLGAAMAAAALLSPHYLAPLIWGSFTFLVDPWNYRRGTRSILRDVEARDWGIVARFALAGLLCGVVWESFNFFAPQKWIYTVRGLEEWKLFEMPLLGFLGFPALAFDALAGFALFSSLLLGGETWEHRGDLAYEVRTRPRVRPRVFWVVVALLPIFWRGVTKAALDTNVGSLQMELYDFVGPGAEAELAALGIHRPRQLLRAARDPERRAEVETRLGWRDGQLDPLLRQLRLSAHKGIGNYYGWQLVAAGIDSVEGLHGQDPVELHARLAAANEHPPRLDMVRVWILAARDPGIVLNAAD